MCIKDIERPFSVKLVMLMSLITASRTQSLHLTMEGLVKDRLGYTIQLNGLVKQAVPGFCTSAIQFKVFPPDRKLCVVTVIKEYLRQTAPLRQGSTSLLISYVKPHKSVSRDTISRWLKTIMLKAGINVS